MPRTSISHRDARLPQFRCCCSSRPRVASPAAASKLGGYDERALPTLLRGKSSQFPSERMPFSKAEGDVAAPAVRPEAAAASPPASSGSPIPLLSSSPTPLAPHPGDEGARTPASPMWSLPNQLVQVARRSASRRSSPSGPPVPRSGSSASVSSVVMATDSEERFAVAPEQVPAVGGCLSLTQPHSASLLPAEVVLFEPSENEVFFEAQRTGGHRQIFLNTPLTDEEQAALRELHAALRRAGHAGEGQFPGFMKLHALRMLQQCRYDVTKTLALMQTHLSERVARLPIAEAEVLEDLSSGFMYWHGRDRKCRPCLVIRMERIGEMVRDKERAIRLVIFVLEYATRFALVPGRVENWVVILDLHNAMSVISPLHLTSMAATAVTLGVALEKVYAGRMVWMKIVNMPGSSLVRSIVNSAVPAEKKKKVSFPVDLAAEMAGDFEPNQLEARYGGTAPDLGPGETYPFRFFPGCRGAEAAAPEEAPAPEEAGGSLHASSSRAFHEGALWDDSLPETRAEWLQNARTASLAPEAAEAASRALEEQGGRPIAPCRDVQHWLDLVGLADAGQASAIRFPARAASRKALRRRQWW